MRPIDAPPDPALLESMRSIGYTVESAVADVVDNSIAAGATEVDILFSSSGPFEIAVVDNGAGLGRDEIVTAMRLAAVSPTQDRKPDDLGRFGLGLKTASLSQCRVLTLLSKRQGVMSAVRWSLDYVIETGRWSLIELEAHEVAGLLGVATLDSVDSGTVVHWGDLDLLEMTEGPLQADFDRVAVRVRQHVSLVFHLFNSGDAGRRVSFRMNGGSIAPADPFMAASKKIQESDWEPINVDGETVRLKAYTLPFLNRLNSKEREGVLSLGGLRETQGFYVYRGGRLVIWGTWFRLMPRSEMAKLTRVRVDIPNSLDHLWALDVKKSVADPPPVVRKRLQELAKTMMQPSEKVQKFRGRKVSQPANIDFVWNVMVNGDEFRYEVNPDHPTIERFVDSLSTEQREQFEIVMNDIQATFPIIDAHNRISGDNVPTASVDSDLLERAATAWAHVSDHAVDIDDFILGLARAEPYCLVPNFEAILRERLSS